jgi:hypothetical protein
MAYGSPTARAYRSSDRLKFRYRCDYVANFGSLMTPI